MRLREIIRAVLISVANNKFRVFTTSLGIIIGTFTIIMVVGIGKASEKAVSDQYKRLSVESITITRGGRISPGSQTRALTKDEALAMPNELEYVKSVGISTQTSSTIAYGGTSQTAIIQGINEAYADITNLTVEAGELFTDDDGKSRKKYAVLGYNVAQNLFGENPEDAIGESVYIKSTSFTVVGVLSRIGGTGGISSGGGMGGGASTSSDDMAFIPYDVALRYTTGSIGTRGGAIVMSFGGGGNTYIALANDINSVKPAMEEIRNYIEEKIGNANAYNITDAGSSLSSALETSSTMSRLLMAVAAIVLIVSGIGIMNVLMVSVKERTREIGILKSIGASRRVILTEFLFEAIFISVTGGVVGVLLSYYAPLVLSAMNVTYLSSIEGIILGLGFSVATGIFFGYYPASVASRLKPLDALNTE